MRGGIISGWLVRVVVGLALAGLVCVELLALVETRVAIDDIASNAAQQAVLAGSGASRQAAQAAAAAYATEHGATLTSFSEDAAGVHVRVQKQARTLVIRRIKAIRQWAVLSGSGSATFAT